MIKTIITEHEQLKQICDLIGYKVGYYKGITVIGNDTRNEEYYEIEKDVREIIFTQEFMRDVTKYILKKAGLKEDTCGIAKECTDIIYHLDNPVPYLYNILGLGLKQ